MHVLPYSLITKTLKGVVWLVGFLTSSSTTGLYRGRAPRQSVWQIYVLPHMRQSWEVMTSVSAGHIILTPTQPVGSGRPQQESNPGPPHQESRVLPTELPPPPPLKRCTMCTIHACINIQFITRTLKGGNHIQCVCLYGYLDSHTCLIDKLMRNTCLDNILLEL